MRRALLGLALAAASVALSNSAYALGIFVCGSSTRDCASGTPAPAMSLLGAVGGVVVDDGAGGSVHIPVGQNNTGGVPVGWTPGGAGGDASPPGTTGGVTTVAYQGCTPSSGHDCSFNDWYTVTTTASFPSGGVHACGLAICHDANGAIVAGPVVMVSTTTCPAGYAMSTGVCTLNNPAVVMKPPDGRCNVVRSGNVYGVDSRDPDCGGGGDTPATKLNLSVSGGTVTAGNPAGTATVVVSSTTGNASVAVSTAGTSTTTTTSLETGGLTGGDYAQVTGTTTANTQGTGSLGAGGGGGGAAGDCGAPGQPPCRIDESGTPTGTGFGAAQSAALDAKTPSGEGFGTFSTSAAPSAWGELPSMSGGSSCTAPSITILGHTLTLVSMCTLADYARPTLAWLFYGLTAIYMWASMTRKAVV